jgi:hypothetical protein
MTTIVQATEEMVEAIIPQLRDTDVAEISALSAYPVAETVRRSYRDGQPEVKVALDDEGEIVALFGVGIVSALGRVGAPWLIGTHRMNEHARELIAVSREYLQEALAADFDVLRNIVWAANRRSIRYLQAVGFTIGPMYVHPYTGAVYRPFEMRKEPQHV